MTTGRFDFGDAVVTTPGAIAALRVRLLDQLTEADWERAREGFGDPELANE